VDVHWLASCRSGFRICIIGSLALCLPAVARIYGILSVAIGACVDQNLEDGRMELARQDCIRAHSRSILDSGDSFRDAWNVGGEIDLVGFLTISATPPVDNFQSVLKVREVGSGKLGNVPLVVSRHHGN